MTKHRTQPAEKCVPHNAKWLASARRRLLAWYERHHRKLPWRATDDPYHVWLSEVMLQQTQVATVIPYFERFIARLPTVQALAAAEEEHVLRLWEGLGYYRRARQLHRAAKEIVSRHGGVFPQTFVEVLELPGVGRYTAGAIVSIAFGVRAPILEANTVRLLSRLWQFAGDPADRAGQTTLWRCAEEILPQQGAGTINQALMELGALVCTPREPQCNACPLATLCPTRAAGLQDAIPRPKRKPSATAVRHALLVAKSTGKFLLRKAQDTDRWAGMWDFPRAEWIEGESLRELEKRFEQQLGGDVAIGETILTLRHTVTRFRITLEVLNARLTPARPARAASHAQRWFTLDELTELPLNTTGRKVARMLAERARDAVPAGD